MNLRGKIQVEPLDEERVVRIERAVVAGYGDAMARGQRAGARWLVPALCGAAVAAALAAVLVWKLRPARPVAPAVAAMRFETTTAGSRVDLGDAAIDVAPGTAFAVTRPACTGDRGPTSWSRAVEACPAGTSGVMVALDGGGVSLSVESRKGRAPLVVRAGDVDVVVVGTKFSVERGADVVVTVTEGVVRVNRGGAETRVAAGQRWAAPAQVAAGTPLPAPTAIQVAAVGTGTGAGAGAGAGAGTAGGTGGTIASGGIETTTEGTAPELHGHDAVVPPTGADHGEHDGAHGTGGGASAHHGEHDGAGSGSAAGTAATAESKQVALRRMAVAPPVDVGATGDDALKAYRVMIGGTGKARRDGFYGAAYTYKALGKSTEALQMLDALRDAKGAELDDVLWMRIQILCRTTVDARCREAAHKYVLQFPGNDRAELANRLTNELD